MKKKRLITSVLVFCMLVGLLASCGGENSPSTSAPAPPAAAEPSDAAQPTPDVATDWPGSKAVTIVCPYGASGGNDTSARFIAKYLPKYLDSTFVVTNIKGGTGTVRTQSVFDAAADGYTVMFNDNNTNMLYVAGMTNYTIDV